MRVKAYDDRDGRATAYTMWLSANDTYKWAHKAGAAWLGSELANTRLVVDVGREGLCGVMVNGKDDADCDGNELEAIVADHLPSNLRHLWPTWEV